MIRSRLFGLLPLALKGQVRRTVRVIVPGGVRYRGQVRAVTWR